MVSTSWSQIRHTGLTMGTKLGTCLSFLLLSSAALSQGQVQHGIVRLYGDGKALLITEHALRSGDSVLFQYPGPTSRALCCKRLPGSAFKPTDSNQVLATNEIGGVAPTISTANVPMQWATMPFIGAAGAGAITWAKSSKEGGLTILGKRGEMRNSETCVSREGFHLMERGDRELKTHIYLSLGYEIEHATCRN